MSDFTNEEWRYVPGFEGLYSVSSCGRVRSEERVIQEKRPNPAWKEKFYTISEKILAQFLDKSGGGYYRVSLCKNCKAMPIHVHRLVAWAFIGPQEKGVEVRHFNGNSRDNRLENLAYGTKSDNIKDAKRHGTFPVGVRRPGAKLNPEIAIDICRKSARGQSACILAKEFGVTRGTIEAIRRGDYWTEHTIEARLPVKEKRISFKRLSEDQIRTIKDESIGVVRAAEITGIHRAAVGRYRKKLVITD